jgi:hypothetical protein
MLTAYLALVLHQHKLFSVWIFMLKHFASSATGTFAFQQADKAGILFYFIYFIGVNSFHKYSSLFLNEPPLLFPERRAIFFTKVNLYFLEEGIRYQLSAMSHEFQYHITSHNSLNYSVN